MCLREGQIIQDHDLNLLNITELCLEWLTSVIVKVVGTTNRRCRYLLMGNNNISDVLRVKTWATTSCYSVLKGAKEN